MSSLKPSLCFVAPGAYTVLSGRADIREIGGAEVQQALVARALAHRGYDVSFVTYDHGQEDGVALDGIRVFKMCARSDGWPILRFFHPRWSSLWAAMRRADADIYYQRTYGVETGQVAIWCRRNHRKMIAAIANDRDCDRHLEGQANLREKLLYFHGLQRADRVVAQTVRQKKMLEQNFGVTATVIRSCSEAPDNEQPAAVPQRLSDRRVLWIGRFTKQKRLDRLVELAEAHRDFAFDVIGDSRNPSEETQALRRRLQALPNVTLYGFLPRHEVVRFYDRAIALLCTSAYEGFPNTFLEAWARGVPTISTLDPDGILQDHQLGSVSTDLGELGRALQEMGACPDRWTATSRRARTHFHEHHTIDAAGSAYEALIKDIGIAQCVVSKAPIDQGPLAGRGTPL